ncbi:MAG: bifunctional hydroxymethylpyrimidine kinase/phosphomethylpyrimidine kinase [Desulfobacteraceae bacterium]|nr:MAG: bifunctional hydroxymethylpyrimidine kinase/phosphomethylpyrimidine kinase [Desulfobacteraceae bacterium]
MERVPTVLAIAGSDPSGGAGIQADLKTFATLGVYGAAAIAALTVQNTLEVRDAMPVPADFVAQQVDAVIADIRVDVIKLGMLPNADVCRAILPYLAGRMVVCDPVMVATSGARLLDPAAVSALTDLVIAHSTYITPNLHELSILCGKAVTDLRTAGMELLGRFARLKGIVLKGGHADTHSAEVTDILLYRNDTDRQIHERVAVHPRYRTKNTHGTGCTLSSAFAAYLAKKEAPADAFSKAVAYVNRLIGLSADITVGHGNGPLLHHLF